VAVLIYAAESSQLTAFSAALAFGFLVGVFGHIIKSRWLIVTGIALVGLVSVYFVLILHGPGST
jgi:hypothetical protein